MTGRLPARLQGKAVLLTGAAQGIGLAAAQRMGAEGARLLLSDVQAAAGAAAVEQLRAQGIEAFFHPADAGDPQALEDLLEAALRQLGGVDICVCSAGIAHPPAPIHLLDTDIYEQVLRTNLHGPFLLGQRVARHMIDTGRPGAIVHVSSVGGHLAVPEVPAYCISKAGLDMLTKVMAVTLAPYAIRVNGVAPGATQTALTATHQASDGAVAQMRARTPLGRYAQAQEMAAVIAFLASDDASYVTGQTLYADGGRLALNYIMNAGPPIRAALEKKQ